MAIFGIGIHVLIALFFAIHAMRSGQQMYWLMILFMFPLLGSIVYFFAIYLPGSRLHYDLRKATVVAVKNLDPGRELRDAEQAFDLTPTAQNQMHLASALLEAGDTNKAVLHYNAILNGPFANDPEICFGAAKARLLNGAGDSAIELIQKIRKINADFRAEEVTLFLAKAYASVGKTPDARHEFVAVINRFNGFEAQAEYAMWAMSIGDEDAAIVQYKKIQQTMKHWNKHTRYMNADMVKRLNAVFAAYAEN